MRRVHLLFHLQNGEMKVEGSAFAGPALHTDSAPVGLHDAFTNGKSESHAFAFFRAKKRTKDVRQNLWTNARAVIANRNCQLKLCFIVAQMIFRSHSIRRRLKAPAAAVSLALARL